MHYLCYDIRGIQDFIFRVPKLATIISSSAIVDEFDCEARQLGNKPNGVANIFAGGGKGAFQAESEDALIWLRGQLQEKAMKRGMSIRFGSALDYSEAANCADELYAYLPDPEELDGSPCAASGLFPVPNHGDVHKTISTLREESRSRYFEQMLTIADMGPEFQNSKLEFFHNTEFPEGHDPLGHGRFAVICMDGNDIGSQFRSAYERWPDKASDNLKKWTSTAASRLSKLTHEAVVCGLETIVRKWASAVANKNGLVSQQGMAVVPVRPLLMGGDDVVVLCRTDLAIDFVTSVAKKFAEGSEQAAEQARQEHGIDQLWPATGGALSISAGVLFCSTRMPLHSAVGYAESLLASAKGRGRQLSTSGSGKWNDRPSPACIDFEVVTEGLLDSPADRRQRGLVFRDGDMKNRLIRLTRRPYTLFDGHSSIPCIDSLMRHPVMKLPRSIRHRLRQGLYAGLNQRQQMLVRMSKRDKYGVFKRLMLEKSGQPADPDSLWVVAGPKNGVGEGSLETDVVDAILLADEINFQNDGEVADHA